MLISCLVVGMIQRWIFASADPVILHQGQDHRNEHGHICHAKVYHHAKFECHRLNIVRDITINHITSKTFVKLETQSWPWMKVNVTGPRKEYIDLESDYLHNKLKCTAWTVSEIIKHLFSRSRPVWPWKKVKVHIINTWCILMSEAVSVTSLMIMTSTVSEESLQGDHTDNTDLALFILNFLSRLRLWKQKEEENYDTEQEDAEEEEEDYDNEKDISLTNCNMMMTTMTTMKWRKWQITYKLQHVPVEDVVIGESLAVEEVPEQLSQVGIVWLVIKAQGTTEVEVGGKLSCTENKSAYPLIALLNDVYLTQFFDFWKTSLAV